MSEPPHFGREVAAGNINDSDEDLAVRSLVKRALAVDPSDGPLPNLLPGVQRRIRHRSRGRFFADGWSTTHARASYALVGIITILLVFLAYFAMAPFDVR
jgi:hypothetical protein